MRQQDETYRPKVTETPDPMATAIKAVSNARSLQTVTEVVMIVAAVALVAWGLR